MSWNECSVSSWILAGTTQAGDVSDFHDGVLVLLGSLDTFSQ